ncbi:hypothetical protein ACXYMO_17435 [Arenibacterium sp. CAU 1754]
MFATVLLTVTTLLIALYLQAWFAARTVRRNRQQTSHETLRFFLLKPHG